MPEYTFNSPTSNFVTWAETFTHRYSAFNTTWSNNIYSIGVDYAAEPKKPKRDYTYGELLLKLKENE